MLESPKRRLTIAAALIGVLALAATGLALPRNSEAAKSQAMDHPLIARAYQDLDTWGGQCWTWMAEVVFDVTGRQIGFDYHLGYIEAGAALVYDSSRETPGDLREVLAGDIIQIASATDTSSDVEGLHTVFVTENLGDGTFNGIDSNKHYDEVVRERFNYDPAVAASRYPGLAFRIYRFPMAGVPLPSVPPSGEARAAHAFTAGERGIVVADGTGLNLRAGAGTDRAIVTLLPDNTPVMVVTGELVRASGRDWIEVSTALGDGWVALQYLQPSSNTGPAATTGPDPLPSFRVTLPLLAVGN